MINFHSGKNVLQTAHLDIIGFDECEMSEYSRFSCSFTKYLFV